MKRVENAEINLSSDNFPLIYLMTRKESYQALHFYPAATSLRSVSPTENCHLTALGCIFKFDATYVLNNILLFIILSSYFLFVFVLTVTIVELVLLLLAVYIFYPNTLSRQRIDGTIYIT